jgi:transposase
MNTFLLTADRAVLLQIIEHQEETIAHQEQMIAQLQAQISSLQAELARRDTSDDASASGGIRSAPALVKPSRPKGAKAHSRKQRAKGFARRRLPPSQRVEHALDQCPHCGCAMRGGTVKRTRQVWHIPLVPVQVIEHVFIERRCPRCGQRCLPKPKEVLPEVIGRHQLSISTMAMIAALHEVGRLPVRAICWYLETFHALKLSVGEVVQVLHVVARQAAGMMGQLLEELRASPVVHGDETVWRQEGQNGYFWVFNTPTVRYFQHRFSRSGEVVTEILGADFAGTLVSDFYGGYNRMEGQHQRCWAHLLRDIHELKEKWPTATETLAWAEEVHALYRRAQEYCARHPEARPKERVAQQHIFERELLALVAPYLQRECPQQVLCKRIANFLPELFTFVADPRVPADNNAAERSIRPLAVSRKVSGGTRSPQGTQTKGILATIFGTWRAQHLNPFVACCNLLVPP